MAKNNQFGKDGWTPARIKNAKGKTFLITGANTGAGYEATRIFAFKGGESSHVEPKPK